MKKKNGEKKENISPKAAVSRTHFNNTVNNSTSFLYVTGYERGGLALKLSGEYFLMAQVVFSSDSIIHPSLSVGAESSSHIPLEDRTSFVEAPTLCCPKDKDI